MTSRSEKKISYGRNILILLLLMAATFAVIFRGDDFPAFLSALKDADGRWLLLGLLCMFLFVGCEAANMHQISHTLGFPLRPICLHRFLFQLHHAVGQRRSAGSDILYEKRPDFSGPFFLYDFIYCHGLSDGHAAARRAHGCTPSRSGSGNRRTFEISAALWSGRQRSGCRAHGAASHLPDCRRKASPFFYKPLLPDKAGKIRRSHAAARPA